MSLNILQKACSGLCGRCRQSAPDAARHCPEHGPCAGYGSAEECPPLIVLAVLEMEQMLSGLTLAGGVTA